MTNNTGSVREEFFGPGFTGDRAKEKAIGGAGHAAMGIACLLLWFFTDNPLADPASSPNARLYYLAAFWVGLAFVARGVYTVIRSLAAAGQPAPDVIWYALHERGLEIFQDDARPVAREGLLIPWASIERFASGPGGIFVQYRLAAAAPEGRLLQSACRHLSGASFAERLGLWYQAYTHSRQ